MKVLVSMARYTIRSLQKMTDIQFFIVAANQTASKLRLGKNVEASLELVDLLDDVVSQLIGSAPELQQQIKYVISQILQCQERQDWLGLADYLQYELVHLLNQFRIK